MHLIKTGHHQVNADCDPDLSSRGVLGCAEKSFDAQVLFDSLKEQFDLLTAVVDGRDGLCWEVEIIRKEDGAIAVAQFIVVLRWVCMPLYLWMYLREVGFSRKEYLSKMLHLIAIFSLLVLCGLCGRYFVVTSTIIFQFIIGLSFLGLSYLFFTFFYAISRVGSEILVWMLEAVEIVFRLIGSNVFADVTKSLGRFILKLRSNR